MRTAEQNRLAGTTGRLTQDIAAHIAWLNARSPRWTTTSRRCCGTAPLWRENDDLLQRVPALDLCARTFLLELPELGTLTRQQIAALVGAAPLNCDSGTLGAGAPSGEGSRACAHRATWARSWRHANPQIKAFYQRLLTAGKVKKVAPDRVYA